MTYLENSLVIVTSCARRWRDTGLLACSRRTIACALHHAGSWYSRRCDYGPAIDRATYYHAALCCLCFVEQRCPTVRRFGAEADARWRRCAASSSAWVASWGCERDAGRAHEALSPIARPFTRHSSSAALSLAWP